MKPTGPPRLLFIRVAVPGKRPNRQPAGDWPRFAINVTRLPVTRPSRSGARGGEPGLHARIQLLDAPYAAGAPPWSRPDDRLKR